MLNDNGLKFLDEQLTVKFIQLIRVKVGSLNKIIKLTLFLVKRSILNSKFCYDSSVLAQVHAK